MKKLIALFLVLALITGIASAVTVTISGKTSMGPNLMMYGTYTGGSSTASNLVTGLSSIRGISVTSTRGAVSVVSISGGTASVSIDYKVSGLTTFESGGYLTSGTWMAIGK